MDATERTLEELLAGGDRRKLLESLAASGDVDALLAMKEGRLAVYRMIGVKIPPGPTVTHFCRKRSAIAEAKSRLAARVERRNARRIASRCAFVSPGRFRDLFVRKICARAVAMGEDYHRRVKSLYQSKYACVLYGRGGREVIDRDRYSKGWHNSYGPARCRCAGARLDDEENPMCVILENWRGTEVARLPLKGGE